MELFNQEYKVIYIGSATQSWEHTSNHIILK